jgi:hypothetical protein
MNKDELARAHLATVLRMAVRLGRLSVPNHAMDAELRDLAQIYLDATGNPMAWEPIRLQGPPVPAEFFEWEAPPNAMPDTQANACGFELATYVDDIDDGRSVGHVHRCQKAPGHDEGPGGSDHLCESCGVLYDAAGGTASPLLGAGLPLGGNGPVEELGEFE